MLTEFSRRRNFIIFGTLFGAWLGGVYAFCSQAVNWIALPGIPLTPPGNSLEQYIFQYILVGALLGVVTSLPNASAAGIALGGLFGALGVTLVAAINQWGQANFVNLILILFTTLLPMIVLMMPIAYLVRKGMDAQEAQPDRPELWARRYIMPFLLTMVIVLIGSFSLQPPDVRSAFRLTQTMIVNSQSALTEEALPKPFQVVNGLLANVNQPYSLAYSDRVDTFMGPRPATGELSQFLIIASFKNGFQVACVFSGATSVPNCTNY